MKYQFWDEYDNEKKWKAIEHEIKLETHNGTTKDDLLNMMFFMRDQIRGVRLLESRLNRIEHENNTKWIPVTERLPKQAGHYLVTSEINYYHGGCQDTNNNGTTNSMVVAYYDGTDRIGGKNYWNYAHVKAWQPLPEVYRG